MWAGTERASGLLGFKDDQIAACRHRYQAFFDAVDGQLDGDFAFEDTDCGYLLLNELIYGEETTKLARFLLEDFKHYVAARKQAGDHVLHVAPVPCTPAGTALPEPARDEHSETDEPHDPIRL